MSLPSRSLLALSLLVPASVAGLWSADAQACDWIPGIVSQHPADGATLASNDNIVLGVLEADLSQTELQVLVDDQEVEVESAMLFDGESTFLSTDHFLLTLAESPSEGATVVISADADEGELVPLASYVVGPADGSPVLSAEIAASLSVAFQPFDESDSCAEPARYRATLELDAALDFDDGARSRFLEVAFYPAEQGPEAAVGRTIRDAQGVNVVTASVPADADPSTLCVRGSVVDALGEEAVLLEDCALCDSFPELCDDGSAGETEGGETDGETESESGGETEGEPGGGESGGEAESDSDSDSAGAAEGGSAGGCSVGGGPGAPLAFVMLGMMAGSVRRRRR
ncbi:MAG: MYXO-CTERM sorting domain-containing protein [Myxococcota bacterium]